MYSALVFYFTTCKNVLLSPRRFYRDMSITEGIRAPFYLLVAILYTVAAISYVSSYVRGYFIIPALKVNEVTSAYAAIALGLMPFFYLFIIYCQSVFIYRIGNFFGGSGNFEGAFKAIAFTMTLMVFMLIPFVGLFIAVYGLVILVMAIKEVFDIDWISATLTLIFTYVFTFALYFLALGIPAFLAKLVDMTI